MTEVEIRLEAMHCASRLLANNNELRLTRLAAQAVALADTIAEYIQTGNSPIFTGDVDRIHYQCPTPTNGNGNTKHGNGVDAKTQPKHGNVNRGLYGNRIQSDRNDY